MKFKKLSCEKNNFTFYVYFFFSDDCTNRPYYSMAEIGWGKS